MSTMTWPTNVNKPCCTVDISSASASGISIPNSYSMVKLSRDEGYHDVPLPLPAQPPLHPGCQDPSLS